MSTTELVISAWSAISPFGYGRDAFARGVLDRRDTAAPVDRDRWSVPDSTACVVPDFDPRVVLGSKGTRAMNRVSGLAVATTGQLLDDIHFAPGEDTGFVLGTTTGSAQSMMDFTRTSLTEDKPFHVEPANAPGCVMNCAAGQAAIWHGMQGPNTTIAAGRATGLMALKYTRRLLLAGRADKVLCGVAEEYSDARAWLEYHRRGGGNVMGEGCAILLLELASKVAADRSPLATVAGIDVQVCLDGDVAGTLRVLVRRLLDEVGIEPSQVWSACADASAGAEEAVLREMFGDDAAEVVPSLDLIGDTSAASAMFQVAAVLSVAASDPRSSGRYAVVSAVDDHGAVASVLLRLHPPAGRSGDE